MKKLLLLSAFAIASTTAFAQSKKASPLTSHISLGPVLSLGHSWVSNVEGDRDFKFSPALGVGLVYSRNEHLGFGAQLLVSHEGYKMEYRTSTGDNLDMTVNPVYLRVPLHVIYFFNDYGDRIRPKIYAGPSFAFKVDETHHYNNAATEAIMGNDDQFDGFDAGLSAGAGANIRLSRLTWLNLDLGYYHGLVDVIDRPGFGGSQSNRNLRLNIGLMWGL